MARGIHLGKPLEADWALIELEATVELRHRGQLVATLHGPTRWQMAADLLALLDK